MTLRPSLEEVRNLGHHATNYNWGIQFLSLPRGLDNFTSADLNTRAISADVPTRSINPINLNLRGHKWFQHGTVDYKNKFTIDLYETVDTKVGNFLDAYMDMEWTPIAGVQVPKMLNQCAFMLSLLDSYDKTRRYYTIIGAWLQDFTTSKMESNDGDVVVFSTTWQYDYYI